MKRNYRILALVMALVMSVSLFAACGSTEDPATTTEATTEYNGYTYLAVIPADGEETKLEDLQVSILKSVDEDGESILCAIEDDAECEAVYELIMDQLYSQQDDTEE